ncbi:MAG: hypothetical protein CL803_02255 [Citromicrobium sp.]|nr:hypothetical protein [Citromicrobium sp.]MBT45777.1 hypothetical protein [Citromicrobium sp.]|tara:strand:- start:306 stop:1025 length:720 start_codon:yes stop_codon:yes gene_type:complete
MTSMLGRRGVLTGLGALLLLPAATSARLAPIAGSFVLERVLLRSLSDGKQISVTRRWAITFEAVGGDGLRVIGTQVDANVDAPAALQAMARLEAARDESDLFPLQLDREGQIAGSNPKVALAPLPETVVNAALAYAKARSEASAAQTMSRQFLVELSQHGMSWLSGLPADVFFPAPRQRSISREIDLPDGSTGSFDLRESVSADSASGLLKSFLREAATTTNGMTQKGSEAWTLSCAVL